MRLQQVSGQNAGSKKTHFVGARQSAVVGRQHSSPIGFSVASYVNSNVVDIYWNVWSRTRQLCFVGFGSNVAATYQSVAHCQLSLQHSPSAKPLPVPCASKISRPDCCLIAHTAVDEYSADRYNFYQPFQYQVTFLLRSVTLRAMQLYAAV
jgi:hypothetical protein